MLERALEILAPGWVGSLIGILGVVAAVATYLLTRQRTILAYRTRGVRLLGTTEARLPTDVTVNFRGKPVPRLTRSLVVIWNDGERTIGGSDIVASDPLAVDAGDDAEILSLTIARASRTSIAFSCNLGPTKNKANLSFEFLDRSDGGVVEVLHTGEQRHMKLTGTIRGMPAGPKSRGKVLPSKSAKLPPFFRSPRAFGITIVGIGIAFAIFGLLYPFHEQSIDQPGRGGLRYALPLAGLLYAGLGCFMLWLMRRRYPRTLHVDELD